MRTTFVYLKWQAELSAQHLCEICEKRRRTTTDAMMMVRLRRSCFCKRWRKRKRDGESYVFNINMAECHHSHHRNLSINWETRESTHCQRVHAAIEIMHIWPRMCTSIWIWIYLHSIGNTTEFRYLNIYFFGRREAHIQQSDRHTLRIIIIFRRHRWIDEKNKHTTLARRADVINIWNSIGTGTLMTVINKWCRFHYCVPQRMKFEFFSPLFLTVFQKSNGQLGGICVWSFASQLPSRLHYFYANIIQWIRQLISRN